MIFLTPMNGFAEFLTNLFALRKELHRNPDISGKEKRTAGVKMLAGIIQDMLND